MWRIWVPAGAPNLRQTIHPGLDPGSHFHGVAFSILCKLAVNPNLWLVVLGDEFLTFHSSCSVQ
jgi:hypothetical protein